MVLLIDNYDSFSYNLYQLIGMSAPDILVARNDQISVEEIRALAPERIVISPGPGRPKDAGVCLEVVESLYAEAPILGVCLGHQVIYEAFGGTVAYANEVVHGAASTVMLSGDCPLFAGVAPLIQAARYHSLVGLKDSLPEAMRVTAWTQDGEIMAAQHRDYPVYGLQFHPESILTPEGKRIIANFLGGNQHD